MMACSRKTENGKRETGDQAGLRKYPTIPFFRYPLLRSPIGHLLVAMCLLCLLSACTALPLGSDLVDSSQQQVDTTIQVDRPLGQTFVGHHAGLRALDFYLQPQEQPPIAPTLYLREDAIGANNLLTITLPGEQVVSPGFYRFEFSPLQASHGRTYYAELAGGNVQVGMAGGDRYADGVLYVNDALQTGDLAFREIYDQQAILLDLLTYGLTILRYIIFALFLYVLPGYALLSWFWRGQALAWEEQLGLAAGITIAVYPILLLWLYVFKIQPGPWLAWAPGAIGLLVWLYDVWRLRTDWRPWPLAWAQVSRYAFVGLALLLVLTRLIPIRTLPAPAWGDSVHHTMITQLILDHGGLFQSWAPYAPLQSFTYHFGLHTVLACWAWLSGMDATQSVLIGSQMLNVLAVLALYPLAVRLAGGNRWAGVAAILAAGLLSSMPGFYVNWGRYTQLTGQIVLPACLWAFDIWWTEKRRPDYRTLALIILLVLGTVLNHYRIGLIVAAAGVAWALWGAWVHRTNRGEWVARTLWLGGAAVVVAFLIAPWLWIVQSGKLPTMYATITDRSKIVATTPIDLVAWRSMDVYYPRWLWWGALAAWAGALWPARRLAVPLLLWAFFVFFATNPFLLNLPGTGWVTNFLLALGAYLPIALTAGWGIGLLWQWLDRRWPGRVLILLSLLILAGWGVRQQMRIIDPFYQMVTPSDQRAFAWIRANTPTDARFVVNNFLAYGDSVVVGSDGGWWLPLYTGRATLTPPISYLSETLQPDTTRQQIKDLAIDVRESDGDPALLRNALCRNAITHVYIGDRQGQVGFDATPSIPAAWLLADRDFSLLLQTGHAQVWRFDRSQCS